MSTKKKHVCPCCNHETSSFMNPIPTVDIVVFNNGKVGMIERVNEPNGWALPGGFVDYGESLETAAMRELSEETCLKAEITKKHFVGAFSDPARDPRGHNISIAYVIEIADVSMAKAADDAQDIKFFDVNELPKKVCFDHRDIIADAIDKLGIK